MLTEHQLAQFEEEGYLLFSGLIPQETVTKAREAMWHMMRMDADNPSSWEPSNAAGKSELAIQSKHPPHSEFYMQSAGARTELFGVTHPDLLACCTPDYLAILKQLAAEYPEIPHCERQHPDGIWAINKFPVSAEWKRPSPHLDGGFRDLRLDPGTFRVTSLTYLTDAKAHSGTTIIWPEGPQRIREFRKNNPGFSNHIHDMGAQFQEMDLGEPIEVVVKQGDVLFFHHLLPHAGTMNVSSAPRFAIRYMCLCLACRRWEKKEEWNLWMP
ncbi:phytanoyl-CoA dioxygenase family protein [Candidatus Poribacteria bacterium]|nr:phytanoyl-CoA dioxygenase family protein [Candidatus Poribacteria bacterium]MYB01047.1 phytanoyl-CoA dioxygenase family protein [Candidatus Poribacteria bacterium]